MDSSTGFGLVALGAVFIGLAVAPGTTVGPAHMRRSGVRWPISRVGRVCLFVAGSLVAVEGYRVGIRHGAPLSISLRR